VNGDYPIGADIAQCGHRPMSVTELNENPVGWLSESCAGSQLYDAIPELTR
jgi:hypothetical protein